MYDFEENSPEADLVRTVEDSVREDLDKEVGSKVCPKDVFIIPLMRRPLFPGMAIPFVIDPGIYYEVLKLVAKSAHKSLGLFLTKTEDINLNKVEFEDLHSVGVLARILRIIPLESGGAQVIFSVEKRLEIKKQVKSGKFLKAMVRPGADVPQALSKELKAYSMSIVNTIKELLKLNPVFKEELQIFLGHSDFTEPSKLADLSVTLTTASRDELQEILATFDLQSRIDKALVLLKKELDLSRLQHSINAKIEATVSKTQRDFFLKEQLKTIKKELGLEKEDKTSEIEKFEARVAKKTVPEDVMAVIADETEKLSTLDVNSAEYAVCRNYLDWLTTLPWGVFSQESLTLKQAEEVLNEDHFGLKDVKERILEYISVGKLAGGVKANIIALVGPPGVGKTSIGRSIARALGRPFYRFSVGGMRDEAEIKGHRRTYIGSMPGKLIQALKHTGVMNPVILLDEVDKMGGSHHGDPASALLEVLDPEQNKEFLDHYLDVRCDLSNVLFLVTANILDAIPEPLRDRMEVLRLSGYILEEKLSIAQDYLIPRNRKNMGLKASQVSFTPEAIKSIINGYAREAGVRSLENYIKKILRKVAHKIVLCQEKSSKKYKKISISEKTLTDFLGKPIFLSDRFHDTTPVGVCMGLAWTSLGGATLYIESLKIPADKTEMKLTGQAGDVMKESSQIAWSYVHSKLGEYAPGMAFFEKTQVHLHIPEGATPKDGPSAGIAMVTALLSLLKGVPVAQDLGMTGEITLTGKVLPIGGVKEKFIAGKRSGLKMLIFPKENQRDYEELPDYVKKGMKVLFVSNYDEVFHAAFP